MAAVIHFEAGTENYEGRVAVGQVVMNRLGQQGRPKTICGVVTQPWQFTWYHEAPEKLYRKDLYKRQLNLARQIINGEIGDPTAGSSHFHTTRTLPRWAKHLQEMTVIGQHVFYKERY